jgi:DNA-binding transcriptional LysR family regulator
MLNETDLSRVDLNLLALFEVVYRERHVSRAAERLNLSPSAISHSLGRLRQLLHDPLFLRHPKGVVPTERAEALAAPIADILAQVRRVVAAADPFDPARSGRRFTLGTTDGIATVVLPPLLANIRATAPAVEVRVRQLMPAEAAAALDAREVDIAVVPLDDAPARFATRALYEEDFVIAARACHPLGPAPSLDAYCGALHLLVSPTGDSRGFVDAMLEQQGLSRRMVLTVPSFMLALATIAETDLVAALPRGQVQMHGGRFGVVSAELPMPLGPFVVRVVIPQVAMADAGLAWLVGLLEATQTKATGRQ